MLGTRSQAPAVGARRRWRVPALVASLATMAMLVPGGSAGAAAAVPGVDKATVTIGVIGAAGTGGLSATTGAPTNVDVDVEAMWKALLDDLNSKGGLLGRQVKAVFAPFNASATSWTADMQSKCATFTEDNKVWAVFMQTPAPGTLVLAQCLHEVNSIIVQSNAGGVRDEASFDVFGPHYLSPELLYADRYSNLIKAAPASFFKGAKFGVIYTQGTEQADILNKTVKPALEKRGATLVDQQAITTPDSGAGVNASAALFANAVLRLKASGVDHLFFLGMSSVLVAQYYPAARAQNFLPKLFFTTEQTPNFQTTGTTATPEQLAGAIGVGWNPVIDVGDLTGATTPGGAACIDFLKGKGINVALKVNSIMQACDAVRFMEAVVKKANSFEPKKIEKAYPQVTDYKPASTFGFGPKSGRKDGAAKAKVFEYTADCRCFKYTGEPKTV